MIDTKRYNILNSEGFDSKNEAYFIIDMCYVENYDGVTAYPDGGKWYIVQSKAIAEMAANAKRERTSNF